jgi:hypothetical protein
VCVGDAAVDVKVFGLSFLLQGPRIPALPQPDSVPVPASLVPSSFSVTQDAVRTVEDEGGSAVAVMQRMQIPTSRLFPNLLFLAGVKHICDNALSEALKAMSYFKTFLAQLKTIEQILKPKYAREKVQHLFFEGLPEHDLLNSWSSSLKNLRWHSIYDFCGELSRVEPILRKTWDAKKFSPPNKYTVKQKTKPEGKEDIAALLGHHFSQTVKARIFKFKVGSLVWVVGVHVKQSFVRSGSCNSMIPSRQVSHQCKCVSTCPAFLY